MQRDDSFLLKSGPIIIVKIHSHWNGAIYVSWADGIAGEVLQFYSGVVPTDEGQNFCMQDHKILHSMATRAKRKAYTSWSIFVLGSTLNESLMAILLSPQHLCKEEVNIITDECRQRKYQPN